MTTKTKDGENGRRQHRRIMSNFGGSGTIQGTEDLPVDPDVADVKAIGLAALFGFALMASVPRSLSIPIPYGIDSTVIGAIEAWNPFVAAFIPTLSTAIGLLAAGLCIAAAGTIVYLCPDDRTPIGWVRAMGNFYRRPKRLTQDADAEHKRTQPITGLDRVLPISGAVRRDDGALVGMIEVDGRDMTLAEDGEWRSVGKAYEGLADALDSGYDIFSPARTIDPARLSKGYIGREFDDDVEKQPDALGVDRDLSERPSPRVPPARDGRAPILRRRLGDRERGPTTGPRAVCEARRHSGRRPGDSAGWARPA
jgi:hypothetical protein